MIEGLHYRHTCTILYHTMRRDEASFMMWRNRLHDDERIILCDIARSGQRATSSSL
jgi:hypothetical protein